MEQMPIANRAKLIGLFIIIAYGVLVSEFVESALIVMLTDIISGLAVIGIAYLFFPFFKKATFKISVAYLVLKSIEGLLMIAGGLFFLFPAGAVWRDQIYDGIHLYVFIVSGFLFYYLLLKSQLVPRFISIWGIIAIGCLAIKTLLTLIGVSSIIIDSLLLLIITNEIFLAGWLIIKGINTSKN